MQKVHSSCTTPLITVIKTEIMQEIFKSIKGYEGYQVSNLGNVISFKRGKGKFLKPRSTKRGYLYINLCKNGKAKSYYIHQLVAIYFHNHTPDGYNIVIDHIDNDKLNNHADNLQLITHRENCSKDRFRFNHSSKYIGVCWAKDVGKWKSAIRIKRKEKLLGYFDNEYDAHLAYQKRLEEIS